MSVVDTVTGEVVEDLDAAEARELVGRISAGLDVVWSLVIDAYRGRAWMALGYPSWDALCDAEFGGARVRLPRDERREVVGTMRDAGMSTRAIGAAIGLGKSTVDRELATVPSGTDDSPVASVTSLDGRRRPATQPARPAPAVVDQVDAAVERYPELGHFRAKGDDAAVIENAEALDGYDDAERPVRRDNLAKWIDADQRGAFDRRDPSRIETAARRIASGIQVDRTTPASLRTAADALHDLADEMEQS